LCGHVFSFFFSGHVNVIYFQFAICLWCKHPMKSHLFLLVLYFFSVSKPNTVLPTIIHPCLSNPLTSPFFMKWLYFLGTCPKIVSYNVAYTYAIVVTYGSYFLLNLGKVVFLNKIHS
jgi:hypothetical protein